MVRLCGACMSMRGWRSERWLNGGGWRPRRCTTGGVTLDCNFETICERCGFFETGPQCVTILRRPRDDAIDHAQPDRAQLFTQLLDGIDEEP